MTSHDFGDPPTVKKIADTNNPNIYINRRSKFEIRFTSDKKIYTGGRIEIDFPSTSSFIDVGNDLGLCSIMYGLTGRDLTCAKDSGTKLLITGFDTYDPANGDWIVIHTLATAGAAAATN